MPVYAVFKTASSHSPKSFLSWLDVWSLIYTLARHYNLWRWFLWHESLLQVPACSTALWNAHVSHRKMWIHSRCPDIYHKFWISLLLHPHRSPTWHLLPFIPLPWVGIHFGFYTRPKDASFKCQIWKNKQTLLCTQLVRTLLSILSCIIAIVPSVIFYCNLDICCMCMNL